ncbi:MAG: hypothetical protein AVO35_01745 [Candidatus Aegiribacteria sp. MLS_C]|nr:MAG: hypothetical protein AVO35_01745 [Candidatus Aegiribacteria sp. MLS_C]
MKCVHCGVVTDMVTIGFKAVCPGCGMYLHACVQCRLYDGLAGRCRSLTTEPVADREGCNFCEEFSPGGAGGDEGAGKSGSDFEALFGGGGE